MAGLSQIDIKLDGLAHLLSDARLAVPRYQRSYAWTTKHVVDLLQDVSAALGAHEPEYFLGSIVVVGGNGTLEVVDGQQRLATTTILIAAIRDHFYLEQDVKRAEALENQYLMTTDYETLETIPKIRLNDSDDEFFRKRILLRPDDDARDHSEPKNTLRESHGRIAEAQAYAVSHVQNLAATTSKPSDSLVRLVKYLHDSAKVIKVQVPNHANAFTIFETLNDRGLDLAIADLLKNYLFSLAGKDKLDEVRNRWIEMTAAIGSEDALLSYLRHYWLSTQGVAREKELYVRIKKSVTSKQAAVDLASKLASSAKLYAAVLSPDDETWNQFAASAREHMSTLNLLGMVQIRPLVLAVLECLPPEEVRKSMRNMVAWAVRFVIVGSLGGGVLEAQYSMRAVEVRKGLITSAKQLSQTMRSVVPRDAQFKVAFATRTEPKANVARYVLRTLEAILVPGGSPAAIPNPDTTAVNLEHILPQNPSQAWGHVDQDTIKSYYARLGNLTILEKKMNTAISSKGFSAKLKEYQKSAFQLTKQLSQYSTWGPTEIEARQNALADLAVKAWPV